MVAVAAAPAWRIGIRRAWSALHRWLGLAAGALLLSSGITGAVLVVAEDLDRLAHPGLHRVAPASLDPSALDAAARRLARRFAGHELVFRLPRSPGETVRVRIRGAWRGEVFLDPATGREAGRRGEREGALNALFHWHAELLAGERGRLALFLAAAAGLALAGSGIVLWWPREARRWREAFRVRRRVNPVRTVMDLHRVLGAALALALVASLASGAYLAWRPVSRWVDRIAATMPAPPPPVRAEPGAGTASLSALLAAADGALPGGRLSIVVVPAAHDRPVRVRKQLADEVHPNGLSSVWLHPQTARVLGVTRWRDGGAGLAGFQYLYPLHTGALGGPAHRALVALAGIALAALGASGAWTWWRKRRRA